MHVSQLLLLEAAYRYTYTQVTLALRANQGQRAALVIHKNDSGAAKRNSSETNIKQEMLLRVIPLLVFWLNDKNCTKIVNK
jgi:hypothetical protein